MLPLELLLWIGAFVSSSIAAYLFFFAETLPFFLLAAVFGALTAACLIPANHLRNRRKTRA